MGRGRVKGMAPPCGCRAVTRASHVSLAPSLAPSLSTSEHTAGGMHRARCKGPIYTGLTGPEGADGAGEAAGATKATAEGEWALRILASYVASGALVGASCVGIIRLRLGLG